MYAFVVVRVIFIFQTSLDITYGKFGFLKNNNFHSMHFTEEQKGLWFQKVILYLSKKEPMLTFWSATKSPLLRSRLAQF